MTLTRGQLAQDVETVARVELASQQEISTTKPEQGSNQQDEVENEITPSSALNKPNDHDADQQLSKNQPGAGMVKPSKVIMLKYSNAGRLPLDQSSAADKRKIVILKYSKCGSLPRQQSSLANIIDVENEEVLVGLDSMEEDEDSCAESEYVPVTGDSKKRRRRSSSVRTPSRSKRSSRRDSDAFTTRIGGHTLKIKQEVDDDYEPNVEIHESVLAGSATRSKLRPRQKKRRTTKREITFKLEKSTVFKKPARNAKGSLSLHSDLHGKATQKKREKIEVKTEVTIIQRIKKHSSRGIEAPGVKIKRQTAKEFFGNDKNFKFDWTPYADFDRPTPVECELVFDILRHHHAGEGITLSRDPDALKAEVADQQGPMHAGEGITVDALVKTIMSQATDNTLALVAQRRLVETYPYFVNGQKIVGKIPNYHDVRTGSVEKLEEAIKTAGLFNSRSKKIKEILDMVYSKNISLLADGESVEDTNREGATDFVPGLLSLDYLKGLSKEALFEELICFPLVGVKTASCILAFNYKMPVFAVDTHVFRIAKELQWVPETCVSPNDACMHLDFMIPDELKYGLHQAFWHHGQRCFRCMGKSNEHTKGWDDAAPCPIEEFLTRGPAKERKAKVVKAGESSEEVTARAKKVKGEKTMIAISKMSAEEAAAAGYEAVEIEIDDNFGADRGNITGRKLMYWRKKNEAKDT